jgi:MerR family copper efflux transcriptional regulator
MTDLTIGKVARRAGVKIDTLRYYEREGVLPPPERTGANYRVYTEDTVLRVRFVKRAQELGFSLAEIKDLLELRVSDTASCADVRDQALAKVADLEGKIRSLEAMRRVLTKLADECSGQGPLSACPVLDALNENGVV